MLLDSEKPGSCEKVADVVRAMLTASSMAQVAKIAMAFLHNEKIVIVRIKGECSSPVRCSLVRSLTASLLANPNGSQIGSWKSRVKGVGGI